MTISKFPRNSIILARRGTRSRKGMGGRQRCPLEAFAAALHARGRLELRSIYSGVLYRFQDYPVNKPGERGLISNMGFLIFFFLLNNDATLIPSDFFSRDKKPIYLALFLLWP